MRTLFTLCLCTIFLPILHAQQLKWVKGGGTSEGFTPPARNEATYFMCTDPHGNIYALSMVGDNPIVADTFYRSMAYGSSVNTLFTSYTCDGRMRFAKLIAATSASAEGITADSFGHVYLAVNVPHSFSGVNLLHIGYDTTISTLTNLTQCLIQYDTSGHLHWVRFVGNNVSSTYSRTDGYYNYLALDGAQNPHYLCNMYSGVVLTSTVTSQYGCTDIKFDTAGNLLSAKHLRSDSTLFIRGAAIDPVSDKLYGYGYRDLGFPDSSVYRFIAAFDTNRNLIWIDTFSHNAALTAGGACGSICPDGMGHLYINGQSQGMCIYNGDTIPSSASTAFIMKTDTAGVPQWIRAYTGTLSVNWFYGITLMSNNKIGAAGGMAGRVNAQNDSITSYTAEGWNSYFTILDTAGDVHTLQQVHGDGFYDWANCVTSDRVGNLYFGGQVEDSVWAGTVPAYHSIGGNTDFFIMKYGVDCSCSSMPISMFTDTGSHTVGVTFTGTMTGVDSVIWYFGDHTATVNATTALHTYSIAGTYRICATVYTACGSDLRCSDETILIPSLITSAVHGIAEIKVYPNPSKNELNVAGISQTTNYKISNVTGSVVLQGALQSGNNSISIASVAPGIYILELTNELGERTIFRIIKE
jgi:hypothetical protein